MRPVWRGRLTRRRDGVRRLSARIASRLDLLLPPGCAVCGVGVAPGPPLCGVCASRLPIVPRPHCPRCGAPTTSALDAGTCELCDSWPTGLSAAASAVLHMPPADLLVAGLKYRGWTALAPVLGRLMVEPLKRLAGNQPAVLVPVPLDPFHHRRRGFNQAALLATELSRATGLPSVEALGRRSASRRQAGSGRKQRVENVHGAFYWRPTARVPAGNIILIDDVLTTGATAAACTIVIVEAGYDCRGVVTFARAVQRPDEV